MWRCYLSSLILAICVVSVFSDVEPLVENYRPGPLSSKHKFAYVMTHFENDYTSLVGLRVLLYTLRRSKTTHDLVVLCLPEIPKAMKEILEGDGAIVKIVPTAAEVVKESKKLISNANPGMVNTGRSDLLNTLNKTYLWKLTEYKRVVFMNKDIVVMRNADSLFYCGKWCVMFFSMNGFDNGMFVLEPDEKMYWTMVKFYLTDLSWQSEGDYMFFRSFASKYRFDFKLPVFVDEKRQLAAVEDEPLSDPFMMMPINYNIHGMYVWEHLTFHLWRRGEFRNMDPPCMTYAVRGPSFFYPWFWWTHVYFPDSHKIFLHQRLEMELLEGFDPHGLWMPGYTLRSLLATVFFIYAFVAINRKLASSAPFSPLPQTVTKPKKILRAEAWSSGVMVYLAQTALLCAAVFFAIPMVTPTYFAVPVQLWFMFLTGMVVPPLVCLLLRQVGPSLQATSIFAFCNVLFTAFLNTTTMPSMRWLTPHVAIKVFYMVMVLSLQITHGMLFYAKWTPNARRALFGK